MSPLHIVITKFIMLGAALFILIELVCGIVGLASTNTALFIRTRPIGIVGGK